MKNKGGPLSSNKPVVQVVSKVTIKSNSKIQKIPPNLGSNINLTQKIPINSQTPPQINAPLTYNQTVQPPPLPVQQRVIHGGTYGRNSLRSNNVPKQLPAFFNDDQPIIENAMEKVKQNNKQGKIQIQIKAQRSLAKLKQQITLPAMCSLKTSGGQRTSVDLICVIDVSGSMNGPKIQLVKSTMNYVLQALTPSDRLSIITFQSGGQRVCGLKCVTQQNMVAFNGYINESLYARGGTNINSGLRLAVKTIKQRKHENKVTSIFLLSDGQDKGAEQEFKKTLQMQGDKLGIFTIHSFGFGTDHDQQLMTKICSIKDGSFYFIKQLQTLDQAFCNALGGVISLVATDVVIKLSNISKNLVQGIKIKKTYGNMWQKINDKEYKIQILQLMSGISKDYVFEIQIPSINTEVGDLDRDHDILQAIFTAKGVNNVNITGQCVFKLTLLNQNQEIPQINENIDVIQNHLRVIASQAIDQTIKKAEMQKYQQAQVGIDKIISQIQSSKKARPQKMENLVNDLKNLKEKCTPKVYQAQGKKSMKSAQMAHYQQKNFAYSNCVQMEMVAQQKSKKSKF